MLQVKLNLCWIIQSFYDYINNILGSNLDYCEVYFIPSDTPLYIKTKAGKKTVYKEVENFYSTDQFTNGLGISLKDNSRCDDYIDLDVEIWPTI
jgi:hypothetical protein